MISDYDTRDAECGNKYSLLGRRLELHLHPPMQQDFLQALFKLGKNNQFIITTYSDYVEQLISESNIIRLEE